MRGTNVKHTSKEKLFVTRTLAALTILTYRSNEVVGFDTKNCAALTA